MSLTKRQKEIIDTALLLIANGGIQNLTIKHLAENLGITEPAIYRHFANKAEIIKAMIVNFEADIYHQSGHGMRGIEAFVKSRFSLVHANPPLAKVMFAEELFMDDEECSDLLTGMMHRHHDALTEMLATAQSNGDIRDDISSDMMFRLIFGPVRLLIKQWWMSGQGFDLVEAGNELWKALEKSLS